MKNRDFLFYIIVFALLFGFFLSLGTDNYISRYNLYSIKDVIVPQGKHLEINNHIKKGLIPAVWSGNYEMECDEKDLSYDDFLEYAALYDTKENLGIASNTDATCLVDNNSSVDSDICIDSTEEDVVVDSNASSESAIPTAVINSGNGINYSMEDLQDFDFLVSNCYAVDSSTSVNPDELDAYNLLSKDLSIDASGEDYKILIYHTHGSEEFADSREGVVEDTVIGVGDELTRILEEDYGIRTYHDRSVYDVIDGELDRSYAYDMASEGVDKILAEYPSIEVVLDIHRDGVRDDVYLVRNIDGRPTAQIMFLNGVSRSNATGDIEYLYNPYKLDNLSFSLQMHLIGKQMYGDLMRRIYVRGYCYNLDKMPRASLIEVGAQTNTVEEAKNAMIPLGAILYRVLREK